MIEIKLLFQGEEQFSLEIPSNSKKVVFELCDKTSTLYRDIYVNIPTIKEIELYENNKILPVDRHPINFH